MHFGYVFNVQSSLNEELDEKDEGKYARSHG